MHSFSQSTSYTHALVSRGPQKLVCISLIAAARMDVSPFGLAGEGRSSAHANLSLGSREEIQEILSRLNKVAGKHPL